MEASEWDVVESVRAAGGSDLLVKHSQVLSLYTRSGDREPIAEDFRRNLLFWFDQVRVKGKEEEGKGKGEREGKGVGGGKTALSFIHRCFVCWTQFGEKTEYRVCSECVLYQECAACHARKLSLHIPHPHFAASEEEEKKHGSSLESHAASIEAKPGATPMLRALSLPQSDSSRLHRSIFDSNPPGFSTNLLSFDGGGIRGYTSLLMFRAYCQRLYDWERSGPSSSSSSFAQNDLDAFAARVIDEKFDLIVGTSIGGIIAIMFALNTPLSYLLDLFEKRAGEIFTHDHFPTHATYSSSGLSKVGTEVIQRYLSSLPEGHPNKNTPPEKLLMSDLPRRCAVTTYDLGRNEVLLITSDRQVNRVLGIPDFPILDACLATSAAPTYFPIHHVSVTATQGFSFIDGGVWANDPRIVTLLLARVQLQSSWNPRMIFCLQAFGTGKNIYTSDPNKRMDGMLPWMASHPSLIDVWFDSSMDMSRAMLEWGLDRLGLVQEAKCQCIFTSKGRPVTIDLDDVKSIEKQRTIIESLPPSFYDKSIDLAIYMGKAEHRDNLF